MTDTPDRSLGRTLGQLALALLNATLILVALCLFLAWRVVTAADGVAASVAQSMVELSPIREEMQGVTAGVANLRADLAALRDAPGATLAPELTARVERLDARVGRMDARLAELGDSADEMVETAIAQAGEEARGIVETVLRCVPPTAPGA